MLRIFITILSIILTIIKVLATAVQFKLKVEIFTDESDGKNLFFVINNIIDDYSELGEY